MIGFCKKDKRTVLSEADCYYCHDKAFAICDYWRGGNEVQLKDRDYLYPLLTELSKFDCGDNSCLFAVISENQVRTDGTCRCLSLIPQNLKCELIRLWVQHRDLIKNKVEDK